MTSLIIKYRDKYLTFPIQLFIDRLYQTKSVLLNVHSSISTDISKMFTLLLMSIKLYSNKNKAITIISLPKSKWKTVDNKTISTNIDTLITTFLQTSILGLNVKILKPFWTDKCTEISKKLWLPTDVSSNFWNGLSKTINSNSWFSIMSKCNKTKNIQTSYFQEHMTTLKDQFKKEDIRTRKIRIYPTKDQRQIMKTWMGTRRFIYNEGLSYIKNGHKPNFQELRNKLVTAKNNPSIPKWQLEIPTDIRAEALRDLIFNHNTAFINLKRGNISKFKIGYCKKKDTPSISIPKAAIRIKNDLLYIYSTYMKTSIKMANRYKLTTNPDYFCRLQVTNGKWFLCVPMKVQSDLSKRKRMKWCSLDPGVRVFQTIYSETSVEQIKIRKETISRLQTTLDKFRSLRDKKVISQSRYTRRIKRLNYRLECLIDDLHHKTASRLTKTYDHIILPSFESQEMVKKCKIKCVNRNMLQLRHYTFKERLKNKCALMNCTLDICTEEYTSQTCGVCGCLTKVGGSDVFTCSKCKVVIDRDVNGARNIAIKRIKETMK